MASTNSPSFDDLEETQVEEQSNDGWLDLEPGEEVVGEITAFHPERGDGAGIVEIDGKPMSINWTMRRKLINSLVVGGQMGVRKLEDTESFEDDETGETVEYNPREARFGGSN